jgi:hypothetical protein
MAGGIRKLLASKGAEDRYVPTSDDIRGAIQAHQAILAEFLALNEHFLRSD